MARPGSSGLNWIENIDAHPEGRQAGHVPINNLTIIYCCLSELSVQEQEAAANIKLFSSPLPGVMAN